jgi:hypothetical protein
MDDEQSVVAREIRTPASAAVAGIIFALILATVVVLLRSALPGVGHRSDWIAAASNRRALSLSLDLIPFAGIAFLWFIGVIRARLGASEDKLFATAFLGSGLLFVAILFTAAAVTGGLLIVYTGPHPVSADSVRLAAAISSVLVGTLDVRMAAVFTLVVTNLGRRTGIIPVWLVVVGYLTGGLLLLVPPRSLWAAMVFPAWVFVLSVHILVTSLRNRPGRSTVWAPTAGPG